MGDARVFVCTRCRRRVSICSRCDRGQRYCGPECSTHARRESIRAAGRQYIRVDGFAPLNFISGGNIRNEHGEVILDRTHSERVARSDVFLIGVNLAF